MMAKRVCVILLAATVSFTPSLMAAENLRLRAPGDSIAGGSNEVGVWKSAKAAQRAKSSLGIDNQFMSPDLECIVRPGTKAQSIKREGSVAYVRASNAVFGGCKGYVKTEFLSSN